MNNAVTHKIDQLLDQGADRHQIWQKLNSTEDRDYLYHYLNNTSLPKDRITYLGLNILLAGILAFITGKKLFIILMADIDGIFLVLAMVVPFINVCIFSQIMRFRREGYQYLAVLTPLSLLHQENRQPLELILSLAMIYLSIFLYLKLFPKNKLIHDE